MNDHRLPQTVKNEVFRMVEQRGLAPRDFSWSDVSDDRRDFIYSRITHNPTGYNFTFSAYEVMGDVGLSVKWTPADPDGATYQPVGHRDNQLACCRNWLETVAKEAAAPDLWALFKSEPTLLVASAADPEEVFTPDEQRLLRGRLEQLKAKLIESAGRTPVQVTQINNTFNYAVEASDRLTKRDWKNLFVGSLMGLLVTLGTNPAVFQATLKLAGEYLAPLFSGVRLPLP